jgi:hypothetical protein
VQHNMGLPAAPRCNSSTTWCFMLPRMLSAATKPALGQLLQLKACWDGRVSSPELFPGLLIMCWCRVSQVLAIHNQRCFGVLLCPLLLRKRNSKLLLILLLLLLCCRVSH